MEITPRFFFYGYASALGGRVVRPKAFDIDPECASALTPAGGTSRAEISGKTFGGLISFGRALTWTEGRYRSEEEAVAITHKKIEPREVPTATSATVEVDKLIVGVKPQLRVESLRAVMNSRSPDRSNEPPIALGPETNFRGLSIDGFGLRVRINHELFGKFDTRSKLMSALDDPKFVQRHAASLRITLPAPAAKSAKGGRARTRRAQVQPERPFGSGDSIYATIVSGITWTGRPHPAVTIDGHVLTVKGLGKVYVGEYIIANASRRLNMLRFEFGSPFGGFASSGAVGSNGGWAP